MKQHIKTVKELNVWKEQRLALDAVVKEAERYELVRTLTPNEFKILWKENLAGIGFFDDLVDKMIESRK